MEPNELWNHLTWDPIIAEQVETVLAHDPDFFEHELNHLAHAAQSNFDSFPGPSSRKREFASPKNSLPSPGLSRCQRRNENRRNHRAQCRLAKRKTAANLPASGPRRATGLRRKDNC